MAKVYGVFCDADGVLMGVNVDCGVEGVRVLSLCETQDQAEALLLEIESEWNGSFSVAEVELDLGSAVRV